MEWPVLTLATPLLAAILVLLAGFPGCQAIWGVDRDPDDPTPDRPEGTPSITDLVAKALDEDSIRLTWVAGGAGVERFEILRAPQNDPLAPLADFVPPTDTEFTDVPGTDGSQAGITFVYQVRALGAGDVELAVSNESRTTLPPVAPVLTATAVDVDTLLLEWTPSPNADAYVLQHELAPDSFEDLATGSAVSHTHAGLVPGSEHVYRVAAVVVNGFDQDVQQDIFSKESDPVAARPLAFRTTLTEVLQDLAGHCVIQRIAGAAIQGHGSKLTLTLGGLPDETVTIDRLYVSQAAPGPGPTWNPWDAAAELAKVVDVDTGDLAVTLGPVTTSQTLGPIDYVIPDPPQDLLVAFELSATAGQGRVASAPLAGAIAYLRAATSGQAPLEDRAPGFITVSDRHYLVQAIDATA